MKIDIAVKARLTAEDVREVGAAHVREIAEKQVGGKLPGTFDVTPDFYGSIPAVKVEYEPPEEPVEATPATPVAVEEKTA